MVSHLQLQLYKHNYGLVCMTGLLGCRWHRYKQSTRPNRKIDNVLFIVVVLTSLFVIFWFYFLLIAINDEDSFNWILYMQTQDKWVPWFTYALAVISTIFAYIIVILLLSLCHIIQGHQLYIHPIHLVLVGLCLALCCVLVWVVDRFYHAEWTLLYLSLLVFGPFIQLGCVVIMTALTWVISYRYYRITQTISKLACLCVYFTVMSGLYISPLFINSPCVLKTENIPQKPKIIAHRGASGVSPENTVISFKIAIESQAFGIETDVRISFDGVPFIIHDDSLRRTTNVASVFPDLINKDPSYFNISQLKKLSAGDWFLQTDPRHSVGSLSDNEIKLYRNQSIPTLTETLQIAKQDNTVVMFRIHVPPLPHPFHNTTLDEVLKVIVGSGISHSQIWLVTDRRYRMLPTDFKYLSPVTASLKDLRRKNMTGLNLQYNMIDLDEVSFYSENNITTNIYTVNSNWLFSLFWCVGVSSVSTDYCQLLTEQESPVWHLSPKSYLILWVSLDVISVIAVIIIFFVQRMRYLGNKYIPEQVSLNSHSSGHHLSRNYHTRRSMKEKLIMNDVHSDIFDFDDEPDDMGFECGGYESTINASDGQILAQSFHGNRFSYQSQTDVA